MQVRFEKNDFPGICMHCRGEVDVGESKVYKITHDERRALKLGNRYALAHPFCMKLKG